MPHNVSTSQILAPLPATEKRLFFSPLLIKSGAAGKTISIDLPPRIASHSRHHDGALLTHTRPRGWFSILDSPLSTHNSDNYTIARVVSLFPSLLPPPVSPAQQRLNEPHSSPTIPSPRPDSIHRKPSSFRKLAPLSTQDTSLSLQLSDLEHEYY